MARIALVTGGLGAGSERPSAPGSKPTVFRLWQPTRPAIRKSTSGWLRWSSSATRSGPTNATCRTSTRRGLRRPVPKEVGPVDVLVNNAGITRDACFKKMNKVDWDAVMHTNLDSVFNMTKAVCDEMVETRLGPDRQRVVGERAERRGRAVELRSRQGGHARLHEIAGARAGAQGRDGEHDLGRLPRHQDGHGHPAGRAGKQDPAADPDGPAGPARRSRRAGRFPWPARRPASSPAPTSRSTAASTCARSAPLNTGSRFSTKARPPRGGPRSGRSGRGGWPPGRGSRRPRRPWPG